MAGPGLSPIRVFPDMTGIELDPSDAAGLRASLARMQLTEAGEQAALVPLTGGVSSLIVRADTRRGSLCIKRALARLKVSAHWEAPVERNRAEAGWMKVAARIVPGTVPEVLGEDPEANAFAMAYLPPERYPVWKSQLRAGLVDIATAQAVGRNLVAIHNATAGDARLAREFAHDAAFHAIRLEPYFAATARAHPDCAIQLQQLIATTAATKLALVHGDVSPKNILAGPAGPVLLDAECAWYGDPAFDLAFCLNHLLLKCVWRPENTAAFLACFDALSGEYLSGVDWEPEPAIEARSAALLAGMLLARIDGKSPVEYITLEADRDRVRSFARPLLHEPATRLADVRERWRQHR
jgi:aminoglycoside phosphotransferase (APT) family kinase protein